ncbi:MAG: RnfABCDGE type electron transport complex subunit B [Candidatus Omnitrophota bacterium]
MNEIILAPVALGLTGFSFAVVLAILDKRLKVEDDPRVTKVIQVLPGTNCGACGFAGCHGFAEAVVKNGKKFSGCIPGGLAVNQKVAAILGIDAELHHHKLVAICRCQAGKKEKNISFVYQGPKTCRAAEFVSNIDCAYGCFGFGDCVTVCPVKAISLFDTHICVDRKKCIGCGKCAKMCPRKLFELVPRVGTTTYYVGCNNKEKALSVRAVCSSGCIACGICVKVKDSPFYLKQNLSYIDYAKIDLETPLAEAKAKCPTKCIAQSNDSR